MSDDQRLSVSMFIASDDPNNSSFLVAGDTKRAASPLQHRPLIRLSRRTSSMANFG